MKFITNVIRVLVGLLFIFSGYIKLNDPYGLSYKLDEYFGIFASDLETKQDSLDISFTGPDSDEARHGKIQMYNTIETYDISLIAQKGDEISYRRDSLGAVLDSSVDIKVEIMVDGQPMFDQVYTHTYDSAWDKELRVYVNAAVNTAVVFEKGINLSKEVFASQDGRYNMSEQVNIAQYLKPDSFIVGFFLWLKGFVIPLAVILCVIEIILGIALLIGWQSRFTTIMLLVMILFFAFLTWYSWVYNKVTDCGCFGNCIPLDPRESFMKDVILTALILVLTFQAKKIKPFFSNPFAVKVLTLLTIGSAGYGVYCYTYLPIIDCLYWKTGNNFCELMEVPDGERSQDHKIMIYHYLDSAGQPYDVEYDTETREWSKPLPGAGYAFQNLDEKVIEEAYEPPIHDFNLLSADGNNNYVNDFKAMDKKLLAVFVDVNQSNTSALKELNEIARQWKEDGYEFFALTSSSQKEVEAFRHEHQLEFDFYYGDNTNLKSIIRSNPGLLLITDTCVIMDKWPSRRLPKYKKIRKLAE